MSSILPYEYKNMPIPGGGYVTGFLFSKKNPELLYARTDIGGTYRYDYDHDTWCPLISHVTMFDLSETFPAAIALDEDNPSRLYIVCGTSDRSEGVLAVSDDFGNSFTYHSIPTLVHGNWNGRGTGYRLVLDPSNPDTLYYASQRGGLLRSINGGKTWETLSVNQEEQMTLVWVSENGQTIVVGCAGVWHKNGHLRGHSLYVSYDKGNTFSQLPMPQSQDIPDSKLSGLVAQRCDYDGTYLYITLSVTGRRSYVVENGYSCDSGDAIAGRVLRYSFEENGTISGYTDITPFSSNTINATDSLTSRKEALDYGFSGITSCNSKKGMLACSTICKDDGDMIFLSYDFGNTWEIKLFDLSIGKMDFHTPYMRPECNGGHNLIHWLSDLKINPFRPNEIWFNTGTGIFVSRNLTDETAVFSDCCKGLEETVHLNLYSIPAGDVLLVDILGDLGGFAFHNPDTPCVNSFADADNNRYITCINADFSDETPETVIVTARGNWTGKTKGGLILSKDQCKTFERLPMPYGLSEKTDLLLSRIECPNVNAGWVAISKDCRNIVWSVADHITLPIDCVLYSQDGGKNFSLCDIYPTDDNAGCMKVFADRVNCNLMYGLGEHSQIYISKDGGASFRQYPTPADFPDIHFGLIDCANKTEVRVESGKEGILYMALSDHGLYRMEYHLETDQLHLVKISKGSDSVYHFGFGLLHENGNYLKDDKAFYIHGCIDGEYGFFRSLDQGESWQKLNNTKQMFGDINSVEGDCRTFGRFYIATGSMGVLYGDSLD